MGHSSAVGFLALALCLVVCVSASAAAEVDERNQAPAYIIEQAKKAVKMTKNSTKEVCKKAQDYINTAEGKLGKVVECKKQNEKAEIQAEQAGKGNHEAGQIGDSRNEDSSTGGALNLNAKEVLENNFAALCELLKEAQKLESECDTELLLIKQAAEEYIDTNNNVSYLKNKAGILTTHITDILTNMNGVQSTTEGTVQKLTNAQLANLHVSAIVVVSKIQTMIKEAGINIKETQNKKDEVNEIVREMLKVCTTANADSNKVIKALCDSAKEALNSATGAVEKAKKDKKEIEKQKEPSGSALTKVQQATDVSTAQQEVNKAQKCVLNGKASEDQLLSALETAKNALKNAKALKQKLVTALSTTTTAPNTQQTTEAKKSNPPVADSTGTDQKDAKTQPMITDKEQQTSKNALGQNDNTADQPNDKLSKVTQNVPTTALTGGKAPAPGAKNDSAMTVSVPLLVALIASAVWQ